MRGGTVRRGEDELAGESPGQGMGGRRGAGVLAAGEEKDCLNFCDEFDLLGIMQSYSLIN